MSIHTSFNIRTVRILSKYVNFFRQRTRRIAPYHVALLSPRSRLNSTIVVPTCLYTSLARRTPDVFDPQDFLLEREIPKFRPHRISPLDILPPSTAATAMHQSRTEAQIANRLREKIMDTLSKVLD